MAGPLAGSSASAPTVATIVTGPSAAARDLAIAGLLASSPGISAAAILEGLALADSPLSQEDNPDLRLVRIAPGCLCCTGNLVLRVSLNRLLRPPPARLFISLANAEHAGQLRTMLENAPYVSLLTLTTDWIASLP